MSDTLECIESIENHARINYKIVVVDNASDNDESDEIASQFPGVKLIRSNTNLGFCKANNIGIKYALKKQDCTHIFILNNDTVILPNLLDRLVAYSEQHSDHLVSPLVLYHNSNIIQNAGGKISYLMGYTKNIGNGMDYLKSPVLDVPDYLVGCAVFAPKRIIKKCGFLDEDFFAYFEDTAYSIFAQKKGFRISICYESHLYHKHSQSFGLMGNLKAYLLSRNVLVFAKKYLVGPRKNIFMIFSIFFYFFLALLRGKNWHILLYVIEGFYDAFKEKRRYPKTFKNRE